ncbi:unnamed protein product [Allacma fusca]|uniref:Uncharacterized protein n=1 Tax=Allacma fusca TaxID=39272 RepID=A0A8J2LHM0_9HEXA|nr:unnamed protein product [Allacma fusca]
MPSYIFKSLSTVHRTKAPITKDFTHRLQLQHCQGILRLWLEPLHGTPRDSSEQVTRAGNQSQVKQQVKSNLAKCGEDKTDDGFKVPHFRRNGSIYCDGRCSKSETCGKGQLSPDFPGLSSSNAFCILLGSNQSSLRIHTVRLTTYASPLIGDSKLMEEPPLNLMCTVPYP